MFVQPHFDDVALSCGGVVARDAAEGRHPLVVSVFAEGPAASELTPFARKLHARWAVGPTPWRVRADEDERAMTALGAARLQLQHHEALYRGYATWPSIIDRVHDQDGELIAELARELEELWRASAGARLYLPLAIGNHVDHQVCYLAGARLAAAGAQVSFYEDFPYATSNSQRNSRLARLGTALTVSFVDMTDWMPRRIEAIGCYVSQLPALFDPNGTYPGPYDALVRQHATALGGGNGRMAECFFDVPATPPIT
jgi:LmbE family N-acetylglucosaminyl deacetylase